VPDLSMIGYAANARVGAATYNAVHTYVGPLSLAVYSVGAGRNFAFGLDRMLGFGLKYPTRFNDTHLDSDRQNLWIADSRFSSLQRVGPALSYRRAFYSRMTGNPEIESLSPSLPVCRRYVPWR
jgi:hypothetical protein